MNIVAKFEKVSFNQFKQDYIEMIGNENEEEIKKVYEEIKLPKRATKGSAGYDFFIPFTTSLNPNESMKIPTGIRAKMDNNWVLFLFPRSGLGFKFRLQLNNTVGVIDADYYGAKNEGHIICKIMNDTNENKVIELTKGNGFVQGIFVPYGVCEDDQVDTIREYGFGSTSK